MVLICNSYKRFIIGLVCCLRALFYDATRVNELYRSCGYSHLLEYHQVRQIDSIREVRREN